MVTGTYTPDRYNTDGAQTIFDITFEFEKEAGQTVGNKCTRSGECLYINTHEWGGIPSCGVKSI